ncbi:endonuclease/exonuclease/phosphatase family protein [Motilimonas pumila]|uniref:Endonuclease/exonuclease/phosphatase family protein n=1 Tax=Motilimonas pumila TaxID=2303987 RepID=A0A418YB71_9GAMM|nr:endonuclease/exonuclease/phosphatase family protein [Motilimonas pumila]RJG40232.1 endonuclease/exonuclease/phosphatase family protein [Motilimonas pumila]
MLKKRPGLATYIFGIFLLAGIGCLSLYKLADITIFPETTAFYSGKGTAIELATCPAFTEFSHPKPLLDVFTLLSWNVYKFQSQGWAQEIQHAAQQNQLILLQEAVIKPSTRAMWKDYQYGWLIAAAFSDKEAVMGAQLLYQGAPLKACVTKYQEPWIVFPKTALAAVFPIADKALLVVNIHGVNFTYDDEDLQRQLDPLLLMVQQHQGPVIFAGDMNTWSQSRSELLDKGLSQLGLKTVSLADDQRSQFWGYPLDHVYYRGLKLEQATVKPTQASDHHPIQARFKLLD